MKYYAAIRVLTGVLSLLSFILLIRVIDASTYKVYVVIFSIASVASIISSFGSDKVFYNFFPQWYGDGKSKFIGLWSSLYFLLRCIGGSFILLLLFYLIENSVDIHSGQFLYYSIICIIVLILLEVSLSLLVSLGKHWEAGILSLINVTLKILLFLLVDFYDYVIGLFGVFTMVLLVDFAVGLSAILILKFRCRLRIDFKAWDGDLFRESFKFGLNNNLINIYALPFNSSSIKAYASFFIDAHSFVAFTFALTAVERLKLYSPQSLLQSVTEASINMIGVSKNIVLKSISDLDAINSVFFRIVFVFCFLFSDYVVSSITSGAIIGVAGILCLLVLAVYSSLKLGLFGVLLNCNRESEYFERVGRFVSFAFLPVNITFLYFFDEYLFVIGIILMNLSCILIVGFRVGVSFINFFGEIFFVVLVSGCYFVGLHRLEGEYNNINILLLFLGVYFTVELIFYILVYRGRCGTLRCSKL